MESRKVSCSGIMLIPICICFFHFSFASIGYIQPYDNDSLAQRKVVFIIVDGIAADMLKHSDTPNLDEISRAGGYHEAYVGGERGGYSETPTISAVGYNSLLTGTWVNKHNVWGNEIENPNYHYPTIFRILKDNFPGKKTAVFSTWLDNRTKLIGEGLPATDHVSVDYAFDGFELDTVAFPHDKQRHFIKDIDKKVADEAARYITAEGPDLSWVYLEFSDDMGHMYGDSQQLYDAISFEDQLIGNIWRSVLAREISLHEEWLLIITTDHGRSSRDGKDHGGQSDRERSTWIVTNSGNTNTYFNTKTPGIVDIMPTIMEFMGLKVPRDTAFEIDGVPLIGAVDLCGLKARKSLENNIELSWEVIGRPEGTAEILLSETNGFGKGIPDHYRTVGTVPISEKKFVISDAEPADTYKVVLKGPSNCVNTWIMKNNDQSIKKQ